MFRTNIKTNICSMISITTIEYYITSVFLSKLINIDTFRRYSIFLNESHTNYKRNYLHFHSELTTKSSHLLNQPAILE